MKWRVTCFELFEHHKHQINLLAPTIYNLLNGSVLFKQTFSLNGLDGSLHKLKFYYHLLMVLEMGIMIADCDSAVSGACRMIVSSYCKREYRIID